MQSDYSAALVCIFSQSHNASGKSCGAVSYQGLLYISKVCVCVHASEPLLLS